MTELLLHCNNPSELSNTAAGRHYMQHHMQKHNTSSDQSHEEQHTLHAKADAAATLCLSLSANSVWRRPAHSEQ